MKKNLMVLMVTIITVFVMILSMTAVSFADVSGTSAEDEIFQEELLDNILLPDNIVIEDQNELAIVPYASTGITIMASFKKSSGKGHASVKAGRLGASKITSTITLQEYSKKVSDYINSTAKSAVKSSSGILINHGATFSLSSKKTYRIKITIKAKVGTATDTRVVYRKLIAS